MFWCLLSIFRETTAVLARFLQCCYKMYNIPCFIFLIYNAVTMFKTICILSHILRILKMSVKIIRCSTLISVGSSYLLCMLVIYVFTVSSCVWVCSGVEISKVPHSCCCGVPLTPLEEQYNNRNKNAQC